MVVNKDFLDKRASLSTTSSLIGDRNVKIISCRFYTLPTGLELPSFFFNAIEQVFIKCVITYLLSNNTYNLWKH